MKVTIDTPRFHREPGAPTPASPPATREDFEALSTMTQRELTELGLRPWCDPDDEDWPYTTTLMLLPGEWYQHIPEGATIVTIACAFTTFALGVTSDDIRFGCLSYGVLAAPG